MFTSFSLPFWNVNCNGKYKESGASPSASMHANPCQICTGFAAVWEVTQPFPMATASHEGELSAHLWSSIEGMLLAGRVWGYCNEYNCFSHFICRSFFFFFSSCLQWSQLFISGLCSGSSFVCLFPFLLCFLHFPVFPLSPPADETCLHYFLDSIAFPAFPWWHRTLLPLSYFMG